MASLFDLLPPPKNSSYEKDEQIGMVEFLKRRRTESQPQEEQPDEVLESTAPDYPSRVGWIPKTQADYGDGGAYPEILVAQYPLKMGLVEQKRHLVSNQERSILPYHMGANGEEKFSALAEQGHESGRTVYSTVLDIIAPFDRESLDLSKPSEEDILKNTEATQKAINERVNRKIAVAHKLKAQSENVNMQKYFKITSFDDAQEEKVVQIIDEQVDPLEPPKFKTKRLHRAPASPPVPILHSPKRKAKKTDKKNWHIPPCISNWKNPRGYTIPLDKRLAADGRGLKEVQINDRFADFAESMYVAESTAREELEKRAKYQEAILLKQREQKEAQMRELAMKARQERMERVNRDDGVREREEIRREIETDRKQERRREQRLKRKRREYENENERERDITEKIALGVAPKSQVDQIDTRLYEQAGQGLGRGFGRGDEYNIYDKPFKSVSNEIYTVDEKRMKENVGDMSELQNLDRFSRKALGHDGKDDDNVGQRQGPVMFEREGISLEEPEKKKRKLE